MNEQPKAVFGLVTDIQYANCGDRLTKDGLRRRYYRASLNLLQNAVDYWQSFEEANHIELKFIIQLGDLIDGQAGELNESHESMSKVLSILKGKKTSVMTHEPTLLNVWGNHDLYNFKRSELINMPLNTARVLNYNERGMNSNYYLYEVSDKLNLICLDLYELAIIGYDRSEPIYAAALELIEAHKSNNSSHEDLKYLRYNGAAMQPQLTWLTEQLEMCRKLSKKVIIAGHIPLRHESSCYTTLPFNSTEILDIIYEYERVCVAYFAGHYHEGGHFMDEHNILHITFPAVLETPPDNNSYATVQVFENKILVEIVHLTKTTFEIAI